jgi:hypothetical protein
MLSELSPWAKISVKGSLSEIGENSRMANARGGEIAEKNAEIP